MRKMLIAVLAVAATAAPACKKDEKKKAAAAESKQKDTPATPTNDKPADDQPAGDSKLVERGKYLADLAGCMFCHTGFGPNGGPDLDKAWGGGLEVPEKFGTWRSPNISQDKDTGIGAWTDQQIIDAVREGKRPTGSQMFPIMPYLFYNAMSNEDARALVAFLRTLPAVSNRVERVTSLKLPEIPAPPATGKAVDPADPVAYGGYLASLMHCAMCHTPPGKDGMPDMSKLFAGGMHMEMPMMGEGVLYSSNLTPDPKTGIGGWTEDDVIRALKEMRKKDGTPIMGPMALYQGGWFRMENDDAKAIAAFLKAQKPIANKVPKLTFKPKGAPAGDPPKGGSAPEGGN